LQCNAKVVLLFLCNSALDKPCGFVIIGVLIN